MRIPILSTVVMQVLLFIRPAEGQSIDWLRDSPVRWAAECGKLSSLTPVKGALSLKKFYLDKLKTGSVTAYRFEPGLARPVAYSLSMPGIERQQWLKGLVAELPPYKHPKGWHFADTTKQPFDPERVRYYVPDLGFSTDSCCGCDESEAFRLRQILYYHDAYFSVHNLSLAPLCARRAGSGPLQWYPLCEVAYCDRPGESATAAFVGTDVLDYQVNRDCEPVTAGEKNIIKLVWDDVVAGKLLVTDASTGERIPPKEFLTWQMPVDTVLDVTGNSGWKAVPRERNLNEDYRFRIEQDFYFDSKNEKLYSRVRSVLLMEPRKLPSGQLIGYRPLYRLEKSGAKGLSGKPVP